MRCAVFAVLRGAEGTIGPKGHPSGINKVPVHGPAAIGATGLADDFHGDPRSHGGPEKALHHYPLEHYAFWRNLCGPLPLLAAPGAFGENIACSGLVETTVHLGDVFRLGTALVRVSQARQPCWKLNVRLGRDDIAATMQEKGLTGWYYKVLEPGGVAVGDFLTLEDRPLPQWPLARLLRLLHIHPLNASELREAIGLDLLPEGWRRLFTRRLETGRVEDWNRRLHGANG